VDETLPLMKADRRHRDVRADWKARRRSLAHSTCHTADLPVILADYPSSVLGAVSESYGDSVSAFARGQGEHLRRMVDVMHLRCDLL
jgi:hypothetical protein